MFGFVVLNSYCTSVVYTVLCLFIFHLCVSECLQSAVWASRDAWDDKTRRWSCQSLNRRESEVLLILYWLTDDWGSLGRYEGVREQWWLNHLKEAAVEKARAVVKEKRHQRKNISDNWDARWICPVILNYSCLSQSKKKKKTHTKNCQEWES